MTIRYRLRFLDVLSSILLQLPKARLYQFMFLFMAIISIGCGINIASVGDETLFIKTMSVVIFAILSYIFFLFVIFILVIISIFLVKDNRDLLYFEISIVASDDTIKAEMNSNIQITKWNNIHNISWNDFFISIAPSDIRIYCIPVRIFSSRDEAYKFYLFTKERWLLSQKTQK